MTMSYRAATSFTILVFFSSTTINAHAKIEQIFASETQNNLAQQNVLTLAEESPLQATPLIDTVGVSADNVAEPDEHHRIVILVPQLVHPSRAALPARARKPKKKKPVAPRPPKKKPKTHHHHHHPVVPVVHSGKVIHAHHHHGLVDHGHKHAGKAKHSHKHYLNANHKHGHYGVGRVTHKHIGPIKPPPPPPPPPPPHKPKHPHLTAGGGNVDVFNQNSYFPSLPQHQQQQQQRPRQNPYQYQQYNNQPQTFQPQPPPHLQHQQQVLHHRNSAPAAPNFFNAPAPAAVDPYSTFFNGGGSGVAPFGNRGRTANDRHDFLAPPGAGNGAPVAQLIQIRRLPSSKEDKSFDSFIDKNTRSSLAAAALAFGNENINNDNNENEDEAEAATADADEDNENENENENEIETENENETENETDNENEKDDEAAGYVAAGALERAVEDVAFDAIPNRQTQKTNAFGRTRRPFGAVPAASEENFATLQLNSIDHGGGGVHQNEASLRYATFASPPPQALSPKNKVIAFSDAYHYQY